MLIERNAGFRYTECKQKFDTDMASHVQKATSKFDRFPEVTKSVLN